MYLKECVMELTAKLFANGRSQAVRLPAAFRFDEKEVYIRQDALTQDVILSRRPSTWDGLFAAISKANLPADFLASDERSSSHATQERDPLEGFGATESC
jgi:antitoxin VapB